MSVGVDTRNLPRRHVCPQLSWHDIPVGTRFEKQNRLRDTGGGVAPVADWSEDPALEVSERVQVLERAAGRNFGRRGSRGEKSQGPRQHFGAGSLEIVQSHILISSSRSLSWCRGLSFQILCKCDSVPHCDGKRHQPRRERLQRTCHVHLITKAHVSQRWRHEQQLSSIGLRRQVLRSRGTLRSLCKL